VQPHPAEGGQDDGQFYGADRPGLHPVQDQAQDLLGTRPAPLRESAQQTSNQRFRAGQAVDDHHHQQDQQQSAFHGREGILVELTEKAADRRSDPGEQSLPRGHLHCQLPVVRQKPLQPIVKDVPEAGQMLRELLHLCREVRDDPEADPDNETQERQHQPDGGDRPRDAAPLNRSTNPPMPRLPAVMAMRCPRCPFRVSPASRSRCRVSRRTSAIWFADRCWVTRAIEGAGRRGYAIASACCIVVSPVVGGQ
jgi:hypothetical protein